MSNLVVAIDGPSASGKSTVGRKVAALLGCVYVDSGSLYRGLTWKVAREQGGGQGLETVVKVMESMRMQFFLDAGSVRFTIDGVDPGQDLRSEPVGKHVSAVAAMAPVRTWMVDQLRGMTRFGSVVMEGRDIGTVVFPETPFKFYLDADLVERARRRHREMTERNEKSELGVVQGSLSRRDARDTARRVAPLQKASGAHVIDTTTMSVEEVVARIVDIVRNGA